MGRIFSIAYREMRSYFDSPVAYVVLCVFLLMVGYLYFSTLFLAGYASLRSFFDLMPVMLVVFAPALTMRLIAEERKSGTIEHLLTFPVTDTQVIFGKFLAAMMILGVGIALTLPYVVSVALLVPASMSLDMGPVYGGYIGLFFLSASLLALGLLASSLTRNQIVAFIVGLMMCFFFFFIGRFAQWMPAALAPVLEFLSVDYHFGNIQRGVIDTRDVIFYISLTSAALMCSVFSLRYRRD